ncbi:J domain-containing protein [Sinomonas sp. JGH33]|uniref:J domain-containing protein n=1 Tax=Sinomonas terricola TaxID=3110330 RepID=A0ABU5T0V2_9MICC|nr:J domain-containing protein [Sinomonas sp. JGH33]MEA5453131.1 J domain-containing protein [Sinomonas sp. JGH33]
MTSRLPSHYEVLGVPVTASPQEVKAAYRRAARVHHPDHGGDPAEFRRVTLAYEVLSDPKRREAYDHSYFMSSPQRETAGTPWSPGAGGTDDGGAQPPSSGHHGDNRRFFTERRTPGSRAQRNPAGEPAVYEPPYAAGMVPLVPQQTAARREHGEPRRRGVFGAAARIEREQRTAALIRRQILSEIPSARLVNGLHSPAGGAYVAHAVLAGYRLALVDSMLVPVGNYAWDGAHLLQGSRAAAPPLLANYVRMFQEAFPELNVQGFVLVQTPDASLHQPVIDVHRNVTGGIEPLNASKFVRELKFFLASGPQPNTVYVPALARLLTGLH